MLTTLYSKNAVVCDRLVSEPLNHSTIDDVEELIGLAKVIRRVLKIEGLILVKGTKIVPWQLNSVGLKS